MKDITVDDFHYVRVSNKKIRKPDCNVPFDALEITLCIQLGPYMQALKQ